MQRTKRPNSVDIPGFEGLYSIYSDGRVYSFISSRFLKVQSDKAGYIFVVLHKNGSQKNFKVHRLVAKAFVQGDNSLDVNHINGIKSDNRFENLEWVTKTQNMHHAKTMGLVPKGDKCHKSKLSPKQIKYIRKSRKSAIYLGEKFGVSSSNIYIIRRGETWKGLNYA